MKVKHIRGGIWRVSDQLEDGLEEPNRIPIVIQFNLNLEESGLEYRKAWAWACPVQESDTWMLRSWLEENEQEILDIIEMGGL